ncbi:hypothetical protein BU25DRAFT_424647 [Macroventuria anomochaeta]|uniref:Uncharacterized protein n=1 Tax=Macroventuria anomochaeta TaxID=301207 RepID=A0ACB6RP62_9PLEO|nr:uncharacterized protein BU25DRAFT_424647 [Macroventuria anomochaeta]KAF2623681.1 hypothetical protein BU25DRAFT_424647 [Macroventuria anomochaeta]
MLMISPSSSAQTDMRPLEGLISAYAAVKMSLAEASLKYGFAHACRMHRALPHAFHGVDWSTPPISIPRRLSSLRAGLKRKPLSTINEDKVPSLRSVSTGSLIVNTALPCQPPAWSHSSEHLIHIQPSEELQALQSVSSYSTNDGYGPMPRLYRTQSQWMAPPPESYMPSGMPVWQGLTTTNLDNEDPSELGGKAMAVGEDLSREEIASLFRRIEEYEREHPEIINDAGKVWVRVDRVGHGLTKTFKTMGSLHKKRTFEARLGHNVPVQSQLKIYEKPNTMRRIGIVVRHCWRRFRNWSTGRDTGLQAKKNVVDHPHPFMNVSIVSLTLPDPCTTRPQPGPRKLSRAGKLVEGADGTMYVKPARKDSKFSIGEQPWRRNPKLFLDIYPSDRSANGSVRG